MPRARKLVEVTGGQPKTVRNRLAMIAQAHPRHALTNTAVLRDARDPNSPLHKRLPTDPDKALEAAQKNYIRQIIASVHVRVIVAGQPTQVRAWISMADGDGKREYHERETTSGAVLESAAQDIRHELMGLIRRWEAMPNFWHIVEEVLRESRESIAA
jgi:hypothetical protein